MAWGSQAPVQAVTGLPASKIRVIWYNGASTFNRSPNFPVDGRRRADVASGREACSRAVDALGHARLGVVRAELRRGYSRRARPSREDRRLRLRLVASPDARGVYPANNQTGTPVPPDATSGSSVRGAPSRLAPTTTNPASGGARFETFSSGDQYFPNIPNRRVTGNTVANLFYTCPLRCPGRHSALVGLGIDDRRVGARSEHGRARLQTGALHARRVAAGARLPRQRSRTGSRVSSASQLSDKRVVTGRGIGIAGENHAMSDIYSGVVAEVEVDRKTGKITVTHIYAAMDSGLIINPALNREPDDRNAGSRGQPNTARGAHLLQAACHRPRLGQLPDPALQSSTPTSRYRASATPTSRHRGPVTAGDRRATLPRSRRIPRGSRTPRDRKRRLRRDRRSHAARSR